VPSRQTCPRAAGYRPPATGYHPTLPLTETSPTANIGGT